ncbi:MAG: 23S rRNA (cytidine(2498)-2'-O)-methyltransferase RlmM [Casimicrobiaceae bacterium]
MNAVLVAHCRAGFEPETARDLQALAAAARLAVTPTVVAGTGYVTARADREVDMRRVANVLGGAAPVFARSVFLGHGPFRIADPARGSARPDRITPIAVAVETLRRAAPFASVWVEYPDTNDGKQLSPLARSLQARLEEALRERRMFDGHEHGNRLHVMLQDGATAWIGVSDPGNGSPWPMGIPRLHLPRSAPSRSTLKLAEAFITFLGDNEGRLLNAGMHAVDLGSAPGGWTWQLAQRGLRVIAVDNGALKGAIADDPRVTHVRDDGLRFRPRRPVDWVTCDIAESPSRIAALMGAWIAEGAAQHAIFNLKLPMKKRFEEVVRCREIIATAVEAAGVEARLGLRQLYHDREEVTGYLTRQ